MTAAPDAVIRFWRALDGLLGSVRPTRWGAVVTDDRFPAIWDANYARVDGDADGLTAAELERDLLPALARSGATLEHVVAFDAERARGLLAELSSRGHRLSWDAVMTTDAPPHGRVGTRVEELAGSEDLWRDVRASLAESFGVEPGEPLDQLMSLERDVLAANGKRWFAIRSGGRAVSLAALIVLDGIAYVDNVATDPAFRGRGYASAVTARVVAEGFRAGARTAFLLADPDEPATIALYERLGFVHAGDIASTKGAPPAQR